MKTPGKWPHAAARRRPGAPTAQFFIPATASLQERRPRTLKHGDTFGVFDHNGDALAGPGSPEGIYHRDTRYLSHLYLTLDGQRPLLLSSTVRDDNAVLTATSPTPSSPTPTATADRSTGPRPHPPHALPLERAAPSSGWRCATTTREPRRLRLAHRRSPPTSPTSSRSAAPRARAAARCTRRRSRPTPSPSPIPASTA